MNKKMKMKWIVGLFVAAAASVSMASVSLDFNMYGVTNMAWAGNNVPFVFDFTINGFGVISLDAWTAGGDETTIARVNGWDSPNVGTTTASSVFNTTFQLQLSATGGVYNRLMTTIADGNNTGNIGIEGGSPGRIDYNPVDGRAESATFAITSGSAVFNMLSFDWNAVSITPNMRDYTVSNGVRSVTGYNLPGNYGTVDLSGEGMAINTETTLIFTVPVDASHGYGLSGIEFDVVPEPATGSLMALAGIVAFAVRRHFCK